MRGYKWSTKRTSGSTATAIAISSSGRRSADRELKILTGVFDPPPEALSWPWSYLAVAIGAILLAVLLASVATIRATRRPVIEIIRDL
jgi:putative ABC transport system permease protein